MAFWRALTEAMGRAPKTTGPSALTVPEPYLPFPVPQPARGPGIVDRWTIMSLPPFYAAMKLLATSVATLPVQTMDGRIDEPDPLGSDWKGRPTAQLSWFSFIDSIMWNLMIDGNAFLVPTEVGPDGSIQRFEIIDPSNVVPAWNRSGTGRTFDAGCYIDGELYGPADFVHIKEATMGGWSWGISKLKVLAHAIGVQLSEQAHVKSTYDDGAMPSGYWSTDKGSRGGDMDDYIEQLQKFKTGRLDAQLIVGQGLEWNQVTMNHHDIQLLEARRWSSAQAASIIGVPPHLIGAATYDGETYSNVQQDMALFDAVTLARYKSAIAQEFAAHGLHFKFGQSELSMPPLGERVAAMATAVSAGLASAEQAAEMLGWPAPDVEDEPEPAVLAPVADLPVAEDEDEIQQEAADG